GLFPQLTLSQAVGAYITAALIILVIGVTGYFDRLVRHIPRGIACGMMAGILLPFGMHAFSAASDQPVLAFGMIAAYVIFRRLLPR
ncbi:benzoate transporter, partial [Bacteroides thetaiotaomicron]|nr:benzoate transporter [Bacteroides thetaiotaomicron]